ncbi:MAG TPA: ATP-dependent DNA helicase [Chitinophagaceae bacterium]|nr:ATP-dependent DNA helicase [Chitinophagaceae bacterium]
MSFNREKLARKFREEYEKLNEKQQLAVNTIEGPVMVIAGPGTGKTQILASRIGKILLETDTGPESILCLTYTDAGVVTMRKRLLQFIGPDAYKVNIYTFHAFCNDVIQENLFLFEKSSLELVSDLERTELFKQLIDSFPKNHPLKRWRGDVYFEIKNLEKLFSTMKQEGWTPAYLNQAIDAYIQDLPNRDEFIYKRKFKEFNAGDLKKDRVEEVKEKMERLRAAVSEFEHFQKIMKERNRYDYDDMIIWVLRAFEENKTLLSRYQEKFLYILVDEYQDTSGTQNRLVELLISYWEKPNVFVVGDDDQSIYRFQGANVENMENFMQQYTNLLVLVLEGNYRSVQPILDMAATLIDKNQQRLIHTSKDLHLSKNLQTSLPELIGLKNEPQLKEYATQREEMIDITLQVKKLLAQGVPAFTIGVIYKENKYGEELARYCKLKQVPFYTKRSFNILELPLAQKIILLLKWIAAEHDISYGGDEMLFELLHQDWFHIPAIEIAKLSVEVAEKRSGGNKTSLRQWLHEKSSLPPKDLFSHSIHEGLGNASKVLEGLLSAVPNITLQQLFEKTIRETGILTSIMLEPDKHWQIQVLTGLFDFVKEETGRNPYLTLQELVNNIMLMEDEEIRLPLVQVSGNDKSVNLMTAHGSKGLEFDHVFFAGCNAAWWEKKRKPGGGYTYPDTIYSSRAAQNDEEELRRLFYVAMTRAARHLSISYSLFRLDGKEMEPSMFIAEILDRHPLPIEKVIIDEEVVSEFTVLHFGEAMAPEIEKIEKEFVDRLLEKFVMNVTAMNNYLRCPLEFYFKNLIRIPSPKNEATEFGSAVHDALEKLFRKMQADEKDQFPPKTEFIADFENYMKQHRESFTAEQFKRRMEYGQEVLGNYYDAQVPYFNKIVSIERNIRNVVVKDVPIKGKLDKLEFNGKDVNVVDYKTGDPEKAMARIKGPSDKEPDGNDYWRQAVFYKILVDGYDQKGWNVVSSEFDFIEPDKKKKYRKAKVIITPADIETVKNQIVSVWQKIQDHDFYVGCGREGCHWCNFVKTNKLAVTLHELAEEEEEQ